MDQGPQTGGIPKVVGGAESLRNNAACRVGHKGPWSLVPGPSSISSARAFALLIVITLLAFVVILLVGLASYTRVETAIAGNTQRQEQARQNALLGLNAALGQLQKYAGPDQRVTATAEAFGPGGSTARYTGVWDATTTDATPLTWLASGNEAVKADGAAVNPIAIKPDSAMNTTNAIALVSTNTTRTSNDIMARFVPINASGIPGTTATANTTIGRYAYWVGDQGVKAPVALSDVTGNVTYSPYDSTELRSRIRQQVSMGAGATNSSGSPVFESRDTNNSARDGNGQTLSEKAITPAQLAFLKQSNSSSAVGLTLVQQNFHTWSPNNFNVLANTSTGGLRQDLSQFSKTTPSPLGIAYDAWADYSSYMEDPAVANSSASPPLPAFSSDPIRRRYMITNAANSGGVSIAPVLAAVLLNFNLQTTSAEVGPQPLRARMRAIVELWNPYSSALVPPASPSEDLRVEITGIPDLAEFVDDNGVTLAALRLENMFGRPFVLQLPWTANNPVLSGLGSQADFHSWLPGRVYYWTSEANSAGPNTAIFYHRDFTGLTGGGYMVRNDSSGTTVDSAASGQWIVRTKTQFTVRLFRGSDATPLATYISPQFLDFPQNTPVVASAGTAQFGFLFRLDQNEADPSTDTWLTTPARDPRGNLTASAFVAGANGLDPTQYGGTPSIVDANLLLDRIMGSGGFGYDGDVPVFELPRAPILSLGQLQHMALPGERPFTIGNSWGASAKLNGIAGAALFDRFFFSGLANGITPTIRNGALLLPNSNLKVLRNSSTGTVASLVDLQGAPSAQTSEYLLQGGAFNLNSTNKTAWAAVLRAIRFPAPSSFGYLDATTSTGTASDVPALSLQSPDGQFLRFSQSAQETYKVDGSGMLAESFRQGMRSLDSARVAALANAIASAVQAHNTASGPFRSLEEFLSPASAGNPSLLEQAIADAGINSSISEFSSQTLTQADIMTALAPVLFPRSDTFIIRAYGDAVNPITTTNPNSPVIEGRAWCEAIVQRVPEYVDPTDAATAAPGALNAVNQANGRRFKIVSFRWLTRADI